MEKKVWQKFILGCENITIALEKGLGGVIFFTKDILNEVQFVDLISEIKSKSLISPFLSIDQEGGRVERTENIRPRRISQRFAFERGLDFLENQSQEIARELNFWGINLNFAPCIDVNTNPKNPIIGERAFSDNPDEVVLGAKIVINSLKKNNIIHCIKHFPGHGDADKDSHLDLPEINLDMGEMEKVHIKPFKILIEEGVDMVMVAHLHCKCFDKNIIPTSLSRNAIKYLREELNYNGIIISDDMIMKGVEAYGSLEAVLMGIEAGVDMFIFRDSDEKTLKMIEKLVEIAKNDKKVFEKIEQSYNRIIKLKQRYGIVE